jgi:hypothetical protein
MSNAANHPHPTDDRAQAYRHLPEVIPLEDTAASIKCDSPSEASGEENAFIAAAISAGG